jgi:hypothetical protein
MTLFALCSLVGHVAHAVHRGLSVDVRRRHELPFGIWEIGCLLLYAGAWGWCYRNFADAFPRMRVTLIESQFRDEVQVPVNRRRWSRSRPTSSDSGCSAILISNRHLHSRRQMGISGVGACNSHAHVKSVSGSARWPGREGDTQAVARTEGPKRDRSVRDFRRL